MRFPRLKHLTWREFFRRLHKEFQEDTVTDCAAQLSYYFLFSLFPLLLSLSADSRVRSASAFPSDLVSASWAELWLPVRVVSSRPLEELFAAWLYFTDSSVPVCSGIS